MKIYFDLDNPNDREQVLEILTGSVPQSDREDDVIMELEDLFAHNLTMSPYKVRYQNA